MGYNYQKLWNLLSQKGLNKTEFKDLIGISSSTLAKLSSNKIVSMDVLAKICDKFDCNIEDITEYTNDMRIFMESLKDSFGDCGYTLYIDKWPKCYFKLSERQVRIYSSISDNKLAQMIYRCEIEANSKNQPNAGIIGTTQVALYDNELVIIGSFAVAELFIPEFLKLCV